MTDHDQRAQAWMAVTEEMLRHKPRLMNHASTGQECVLQEIRRLYALEAALQALAWPSPVPNQKTGDA